MLKLQRNMQLSPSLKPHSRKGFGFSNTGAQIVSDRLFTSGGILQVSRVSGCSRACNPFFRRHGTKQADARLEAVARSSRLPQPRARHVHSHIFLVILCPIEELRICHLGLVLNSITWEQSSV